MKGTGKMAEEENINQGAGTTGAQEKVDNAKAHAALAAKDLKSAATATAKDCRDKAEQVWDDAQMRARTFREDGEDYVRENPMRAVFTALAVGFVLGWIIRR
jgi:ElaB/YqjD/DUF883 family membrane-anchored ribosome-binding protein